MESQADEKNDTSVEPKPGPEPVKGDQPGARAKEEMTAGEANVPKTGAEPAKGEKLEASGVDKATMTAPGAPGAEAVVAQGGKPDLAARDAIAMVAVIVSLASLILTLIFTLTPFSNLYGFVASLGVLALFGSIGIIKLAPATPAYVKPLCFAGLGLGILVLIGLYLYATRPQFVITPFGAHGARTAPIDIEITDGFIWSWRDGTLHDKLDTTMVFQVEPTYFGSQSFGKVVALIEGAGSETVVEKLLWEESFNKESTPKTFSLSLPEILRLSEIATVEEPPRNVLAEETFIPVDILKIKIVRKGYEDKPWKTQEVRLRNAPWDQKTAFYKTSDSVRADLYVKNLGAEGEFFFRYGLYQLLDPVDSSPYIMNNHSKNREDGYIPDEMTTLAGGEVFTTTLTLDLNNYLDEPGHYALEVYAIKKLDYIKFNDPARSWSEPDVPWYFAREFDRYIFVIPDENYVAPESAPVYEVSETMQAELDRLNTEQNIRLGPAIGPVETITSIEETPGYRQRFENGEIIEHNGQAYAIYGSIFEHYRFLNEQDGGEKIRFPVSQIQAVTSSKGTQGFVQQYEKVSSTSDPSMIYTSPKGGAWVEGWIALVYNQEHGGHSGWLGFPIADMENYMDSDIQPFENGFIVYYFPVIGKDVKGEDIRDWGRKPLVFSYIGQDHLLDVHAEADWQDAGVDLKEGETWAVIQVTGNWWIGESYGESDANGLSVIELKPEHTLPTAYAGALIGRIGESGVPFLIGRSSVFQADTDGRLYLRMNDSVYEDNSGYITVQVDKLW